MSSATAIPTTTSLATATRSAPLNWDVDTLFPNNTDEDYGFKITTISGTATIEAPIVTSGTDCDVDGFSDDSTVSWYSVGTGEQNIIVVDSAGSTVLDSARRRHAPYDTPLVKEWNTLAPTWITSSSTSPVVQAGTGTPPSAADALSGTNLDGATVSGGMVFNPATGVYQGSSGTYYEYPIATHANAAGTQLYIANGATVTITRAANSTCGAIVIDAVDGVDVDYISGPSVLDQTSDTYVATSVGKGIPFHFESDGGSVNNCTATAGMTKVNIQVSYPILLGSNQPPAPALETLTINWSATIAQKQVFLAWAGQRIILEHDWRIAAGDVDGGTDDPDPDPVGICPFGPESQSAGQTIEAASAGYFTVEYFKSAGPGAFVEGLGPTYTDGPDAAQVDVYYDNEQEDSDIPGDPQDSCISRVLFESEDQGQVDIEASVDDDGLTVNVTKHAFVIYYMKINTMNVSLVTQVSKPTHNGSLSTFGGTSTADCSPGNPWDASKDDADNAAEWNVSKDLLVRGRVTGWFVNSNPSGRAADTSNPLNVLPANRWVMPNDWPLLAGGPPIRRWHDAYGTAEAVPPVLRHHDRPEQRARPRPREPGWNLGRTQVGSVATGNTGVGSTTSPILVNSCAALSDGLNVTFGTSTTVRTVGTPGCVDNKLVLTAASQFATGTAPAAGTAIFAASGVPFEGPYSLIDIPGLSLNGFGGAALSDFGTRTTSATPSTWTATSTGGTPRCLRPRSAVKLRGTGFIKQVYKYDVYYNGTANTASVANAGTQTFPNPYLHPDIPDSPFIPAVAAGGGYLWDTWGNDGPGGLRRWCPTCFWEPVRARREQRRASVSPSPRTIRRPNSASSAPSTGDQLHRSRPRRLHRQPWRVHGYRQRRLQDRPDRLRDQRPRRWQALQARRQGRHRYHHRDRRLPGLPRQALPGAFQRRHGRLDVGRLQGRHRRRRRDRPVQVHRLPRHGPRRLLLADRRTRRCQPPLRCLSSVDDDYALNVGSTVPATTATRSRPSTSSSIAAKASSSTPRLARPPASTTASSSRLASRPSRPRPLNTHASRNSR